MKKTILITGSTDGIGKLAALQMAKAGHNIYLHGRNPDKLTKVIDELKLESGNESIEGFVADFSNLNEVKSMVDEVNHRIPQLDILINNAGVFLAPQPITASGIDIRIVVNLLAPYLLTNGCIDLMRSSTDARIINLSSAAQSKVSMELINGNIRVSDQEAYAQSKLAILMWTFYLAQKKSDLTILALNPGSLLNTNMVREAYGKFWSSAEKGADIITDLALSENYVGTTGQYFDNDKGSFGPAHPDAYDQDLIDELVEVTRSKM